MSGEPPNRGGRPVIRDKAPHGTEERYQHERFLHYRKHAGPPPCARCKAGHAAHERDRAAAAPPRVRTPQPPLSYADKVRRDRLADLQWMASTGETFEGAEARLGLRPKALDKWVRNNPEAKAVADQLRANGQPWGRLLTGRLSIGRAS